LISLHKEHTSRSKKQKAGTSKGKGKGKSPMGEKSHNEEDYEDNQYTSLKSKGSSPIELDYILDEECTPSPKIYSTTILKEVPIPSTQHIVPPGQVRNK